MRDAGELLTNPFDSRALATALALRRAGETVTALSMGPPGSDVVLREALAAGADRAVWITDPALAGSDAQVTARVLATALRRLGPALVLAGARSTDGETGQVPAELAAHLDLPVVPAARKVERGAGGSRLEILADAAGGWARYAAEAPAVVTVGEKIAKPPRPDDAARRLAEGHPMDRWDLAELGIAPDSVGTAGSPTRVVGLREDRTPRRRRRYDAGPLELRVARAFAELPLAPGPLPSPRPSTSWLADRELWVAVGDGDGSVDPDAAAIVGALAASAPGARCVAWLAGPEPSEPETDRLAAAGAAELRWIPAERPGASRRGFAERLRSAADAARGPAAAWFVASEFGREVAARWAVSASCGLMADVTGWSPGPAGDLLWSKPAFAGGFTAELVGRGELTLATVRPGVFGPPAPVDGRTLHLRRELPLPPDPSRLRRLDGGREAVPEYGRIAGARRLVTVGMGVGGPEGIRRLVPYLARWDAALGATRRVVDAGWVPAEYQVGLSGVSAAPDLAVLLGVGKATNHVVGLRRAGRLVAVNSDPAAPVLDQVDAGVVADWSEALPYLDEVLASPTRP